jgi:tryptophanyl-tRNA synthetase
MTGAATKRERVFSGIQPSGEIHVGNYLGALKTWVSLLDTHECIFSIVDYHALTGPSVPAEMPGRVFEAVVASVACGLDPARCVISVQSHLPEHAELCWLFNTVTPLGSLFRMTQFKDKSRGALRRQVDAGGAKASGKEITRVSQQLRALVHGVHDRLGPLDEAASTLKGKPAAVLEGVREANDRLGELMQFLQVGLGINEASAGLLDYPVLQAADILLYKATRVPVGEDQDQHIELCREIAERFNNHVGAEVFPAAKVLRGQTAKVRGVDGKSKMSKSLGNHLGVLWDRDAIWDKLRGAFTDPLKLRLGDPGRPEICNVFTMHQGFTATEGQHEIDRLCRDGSLGCVDCKAKLLESMVAELAPVRERAAELRSNPEEVRAIVAAGAEHCRKIARETLAEARAALGLRGGQCDPL